jgi:hypothetical protein
MEQNEEEKVRKTLNKLLKNVENPEDLANIKSLMDYYIDNKGYDLRDCVDKYNNFNSIRKKDFE